MTPTHIILLGFSGLFLARFTELGKPLWTEDIDDALKGSKSDAENYCRVAQFSTNKHLSVVDINDYFGNQIEEE